MRTANTSQGIGPALSVRSHLPLFSKQADYFQKPKGAFPTWDPSNDGRGSTEEQHDELCQARGKGILFPHLQQ